MVAPKSRATILPTKIKRPLRLSANLRSLDPKSASAGVLRRQDYFLVAGGCGRLLFRRGGLGRVTISRGWPQGSRVLATIVAGDVFGEMAWSMSSRATATATAEIYTKHFVSNESTSAELLERRPR